MRILHLATCLQGGAGLAITSLAEAQRSAGHDVTVVASPAAIDEHGHDAACLDRLNASGVRLHLVDSLRSRETTAHDDVIASLRQHGWDDLPDYGPAVLHAHAAVSSHLALALAKASRNVAVLQTMHGWGSAKSAGQARADIDVLNRVPRVVAPSRTSAAHLERLGVETARLRVVPYGVDLRMDARTPDAEPALEQAIFRVIDDRRAHGRAIVCCVGTIGERKNQRLLVDALALLPASARPYVVFVGDGDVAGLEQYAFDRGASADILCVGYAAHPRRYLRRADWFVLPSRAEAQPLAVLEAFAERVPVLAADIPELRELVDDERRGVLFDAGSAVDLAETLLTVLNADVVSRRRLCEAAYLDYAASFETGAVVRAYFREYTALLDARRQGRAPCAA